VERVCKRVFNTPKNGKTREGAMSDGEESVGYPKRRVTL
jgi:hypothetical protein